MKILTNKKYKEMKDLITGLQQDYNDLKDKQVDIQCEYKYMQEQKELAETQVSYLQNEIAFLKGEGKRKIENKKNGGKENGKSNKSKKN